MKRTWTNVVKGQSELVKGKANGSHHGSTAVLDLRGLDKGASVLGSVLRGELIPIVLPEKDWLFSPHGCGWEARDSFLDLKKRHVIAHAERRRGRGRVRGGHKRCSAADETQKERQGELHLLLKK